MRRLAGIILVSWCVAGAVHAADDPAAKPNVPPKGFTALFNGKDLKGWRGLGHVNPYDIAKWTPEERERQQKAADEDMQKHWRAEGGEIINDGQGVYLTTDKDYRDFELLLEWRMMTPNTDSGIYLRGSPQVQIWDPGNKNEVQNGADKGSGALWNNMKPEGKFPPMKADKPVGEWNSFKITMIGERVTVLLNGQKTVDHAVMENFWDRARPMLATGPVQLQTHGGEMRFRNLFIREIAPEEANKILMARGDEGFKPLFNGRNMDGWIGDVGNFEVKDGVASFTGKGGGVIFTKDTFSDFAIRFEFKIPPGGNNGLGIRTPAEGDPAFVGMEIQILDDVHPQYAGIKPWQHHGSIYGVAAAHPGYLRPAGQWNYEEVIANGPKIQVILNGTKIVDADISKVDKTLDEREHPGLHNKDGHIGFLGHGYPIDLRNVRIKPLK